MVLRACQPWRGLVVRDSKVKAVSTFVGNSKTKMLPNWQKRIWAYGGLCGTAITGIIATLGDYVLWPSSALTKVPPCTPCFNIAFMYCLKKFGYPSGIIATPSLPQLQTRTEFHDAFSILNAGGNVATFSFSESSSQWTFDRCCNNSSKGRKMRSSWVYFLAMF